MEDSRNVPTSRGAGQPEIEAAGRVLRAGGLVVFPTETVYGLGANALNADAVDRIFAVKGRPADNPLIVHLLDAADAVRVASELSPAARRLLNEFAPGPLTVVLPARTTVPRVVTAGLDTVAVRVPAHRVARALLASAGVPVAAPSANRSGEPSPTNVAMARESLGDGPDAYLDGGSCTVGLESTVVRVIGAEVHILRPGAVTESDILAVLSDVTVSLGVGGEDRPEAGAAGARSAVASPGLRHRHYQPRAEVVTWQSLPELERALAAPSRREGSAVVIAPHAVDADVRAVLRRSAGTAEAMLYADLSEYAHNLYRWFSDCDRSGCRRVFAHLPAADGLGAAIRDRLLRASTDGTTGV